MNVNTVGFVGGRECVQRASKLYLDSKWMHHPSLTGYVTSTLLDTDLAPLLYPRKSFFSKELKTILKVAFLILAIGYLSRDISNFGGWLLTAAAVVQFSDELFGLFSGNRKLCHALYTISEELDSGFYDAPTLIKRLQELEIKGYNVHSLVYPLLRLHTHEPSEALSLNPSKT